MKKFVSITLAILLLFTLGACGSDKDPEQNNSTVPSSEEVDLSPREVTWDVLGNVDASFPFDQYVADEKERWHLGRNSTLDFWVQFPWKVCNESFDNYSSLKTVKEITGVDVTARVPMGDHVEAVNLMMALNDFPDIMALDPNHWLIKQLVEGGYVVSMNDLASEYGINLDDFVPETTYLSSCTYNDDVMWGVMSDCVPDWKYKDGEIIDLGNQGYNVRHDIWVELGKPSINTPDELYNTLKLFKEKYPTMDGKQSVALGGYGGGGDGTLLTIGYSYGIKQDIWVDLEQDTVTSRFLAPNFDEYIRFLNKLQREGLLDPEFFIKDVQQQMDSATTNVFMMPWVYHAMDTANNVLKQKDPNSVFVAIPPMSATGEEFTFRGSSRLGGSSMTLITTSCRDKEAALRLALYGLSPAGSLQMRHGNPGTDYVVKNGVYYQSDEVKEASLSGNWTEWNKTRGIGDYYYFYFSPIKESYTFTELRQEYDVPNTWKYSYDGTNELNGMAVSGTTDAGIAYNTINAIGWRDQASAIMADTEEEAMAIVEQMQSDIRNTRDFDKLEEYWTNQYRKNIEMFGPAQWGNP